ncbi:hypothetical protein K456DRAFT_40643 [Colletotrichum gloeosporioides 23]|nr:hypothetical protein K456DRAFT_40643 [Colletotrichum gloeosporioides 23]
MTPEPTSPSVQKPVSRRELQAKAGRRSTVKTAFSIYGSMPQTLRRSKRLAKKGLAFNEPLRQATLSRNTRAGMRHNALDPEDMRRAASKLCASTLEIFGLALNDSHWKPKDPTHRRIEAFDQSTHVSEHESTSDIEDNATSCSGTSVADVSTAADDDETEKPSRSHPNESVFGDGMSQAPQENKDEIMHFLLREEWTKLRLWKLELTDENLDNVVMATLGNPSSVGNLVLDSLANIADALLEATSVILEAGSRPGVRSEWGLASRMGDISRLKTKARDLRNRTERVRHLVGTAIDARLEDDGDTVISDTTSSLSVLESDGGNRGSGSMDDTSGVVGTVQNNIRRLQQLRFSIDLALNDMELFVNKDMRLIGKRRPRSIPWNHPQTTRKSRTYQQGI